MINSSSGSNTSFCEGITKCEFDKNQSKQVLELLQMLHQAHFDYDFKISDSHYIVEMLNQGVMTSNTRPAIDDLQDQMRPKYSDSVMMIAHDGIGSEGTALSKVLMQSYIRATAASEPFPRVIMLAHRGVLLALDDSPCLDALRTMESKGVLILSNSSCLEYHKVIDRIAVGGITNIYEMVDITKKAKFIINL